LLPSWWPPPRKEQAATSVEFALYESLHTPKLSY
jgi:hypothetical protein